MKSNQLIIVIVLGLIALVTALGAGFSSLEVPRIALDTVREAWVDDDDPNCGGNQPCFSSIQAAIEALTEDRDNKVHIRPGTYKENVVINRGVQLIGAGRDLVRIAPHDSQKPIVLVRVGSVDIEGVGIYGGATGIEVLTSGIVRVQQNLITSNSSYGILSLNSGSVDLRVYENKIENTNIAIKNGVFRGNILFRSILLATLHEDLLTGPQPLVIAGNAFVSSGILLRGRLLREDGFVVIGYNNFVGDYDNVAIGLGDEASAVIEGNHISGYSVGIQTNYSSQAVIQLNSLVNNRVGFQSGFGFYVDGGRAEWMKMGWNPKFKLIRNQILNNVVGLLLVEGQGQIVRNQIAHNGLSVDYLGLELWEGKKGGLFLSPWAKVELDHNYFLNNTYGVTYTSNPLEAECQRAPLDGGEIKGSENEFRDNEVADLCPPDYPWPPGFRK